MAHFEDLWIEAESLLSNETSISSLQEIVKELIAKAEVFSRLEEVLSSSPVEGAKLLEGNAFGKLLLVVAQITAKQNINAYAALRMAIDDRKVEQLMLKYNTT
jgi:hypothetical protein